MWRPCPHAKKFGSSLPEMISTLLFLFGLAHEVFAGVETKHLVQPSHGAIWPKPRFEKTFPFNFTVDLNNFEFQVVAHTCPILEKAIERYVAILQSSLIAGILRGPDSPEEVDAIPLTVLRIDLKHPCEEYPSLEMDESYTLTLTHTSSDAMIKNGLTADSIWGILRGMESFVQILVPDKGGYVFITTGVLVEDSPRFPHRGLMLDTSRHFIPVQEILRMLDGMACSKLNVFHWHIVDDQTFPFRSTTFPDLSEIGAFKVDLAEYTPSDVRIIVEYARLRGIRVIPEFDTPGHTYSWGLSVDGLLAKCSSTGESGPIDPTRRQNYAFLEKLFAEVASVFKDDYIHLGGNEINVTCWKDNKAIEHFMEAHGMGRDVTLLEQYYFSQLFDIIANFDLKPIVWEDVLDDGVSLGSHTVIQTWQNGRSNSIKKIVSKGHRVIISSCWYLDHPSETWQSLYKCDALDFDLLPEEEALMIGGEALIWTENIDEINLSSTIWPRACATAERLWSYGDGNPTSETASRLEEHNCRLKRRIGLTAPANGHGYCPLLADFCFDSIVKKETKSYF